MLFAGSSLNCRRGMLLATRNVGEHLPDVRRYTIRPLLKFRGKYFVKLIRILTLTMLATLLANTPTFQIFSGEAVTAKSFWRTPRRRVLENTQPAGDA